MLLVAVGQRMLVESTGMTAWKGGGMGMYSEFAYRDHEVWLRLEGEGREAEYEYLSDEELQRVLSPANTCLRFRHEGCLERLAQAIDALEGGVSRPYRLEVWRFARDGEAFGRVRILEADFE